MLKEALEPVGKCTGVSAHNYQQARIRRTLEISFRDFKSCLVSLSTGRFLYRFLTCGFLKLSDNFRICVAKKEWICEE